MDCLHVRALLSDASRGADAPLESGGNGAYVWLGAKHVLTGCDHLLSLLGLILGRLRRLKSGWHSNAPLRVRAPGICYDGRTNDMPEIAEMPNLESLQSELDRIERRRAKLEQQIKAQAEAL
jgi:hypothetical protein